MEDKQPEEKKPSYIAIAVFDRLLSVVACAIAAVMLLYGAYVLYDNAYLNHKAFVSQDLLRYKPDVEAADELLGFGDMLELNPDTVGWLTVYDTNIDYPVMQGKDNLEYLNKDPFGDYSLSGSIYLDSGNAPDLQDRYNLIYGHHMASGAMFGDIGKYVHEDFFRGHQDGLLQTPHGNYDLRIFAVLRADAYDQLIYAPADRNSDWQINALLDLAAANSLWYDGASLTDAEVEKLVILSTCADAYTNGRLLLFGIAQARELPLPVDEPEEEPVHRKPRVRGDGRWSLLDLCCTALCFFILLPLTYTRRKYRQIGYSRRTADRLEQLPPDSPLAIKTAAEQGPDYIPRVVRMLDRFHYRLLLGTAVELAITLGAVVLLLLTQAFLNRMTIVDKWTPLFLALAAAAWLADYICFRYRGDRPPAEDDMAAAR